MKFWPRVPRNMLNAEIIAVGSEMLTPQRVDTNSLFLTAQLNDLGIEVRRKSVVGDDRALLTSTVRQALQDAEIVILTGGLGPTEDDLTREAVAAALGRELVFEQSIADGIEARFRDRGRKMAPTNLRQAYVISGAEILPNRKGTAPGLWVEQPGNPAPRYLMLLPGPPREMEPLVRAEVMPRLRQVIPAAIEIRTRFYRVTGMTESDLDNLIAPTYKSYTNPATTILASSGDIQIHLRARCSEADGGVAEAERLLAEVGGAIEELLGDRIYSSNGDSLEASIGALLRDRGATLAVAESLTGGMVAERLTSVSGSSAYFLGGFVTYSSDLKSSLLGVDPALIAEHTVVSREVAAAMAEGTRKATGSDFAVATTGEAGPESGSSQPVGTVYVAVAGGQAPDGEPLATEVKRFNMPGDRDRVRGFTTNAALDLVRRRVLASGSEPDTA